MTRAAACATSAIAQDAAERALADGGSAADAVVAGYFALAGEQAAALFSPTTILVAGPGVAGRAIDGRAIQPGAGASRPRGFVDDAHIPLAARAAVSRAPHAVLLLQANHGRRSLKKNVTRGAAAAKSAGDTKRAEFLSRIGDAGSVGLASANEAIVRAAGPYASGLVTVEDLERARPADTAATLVDTSAATGEAMRLHFEPWPGVAPNGPALGEAVLAVDARGLLVALSCFVDRGDLGGLLVPEVQVALPLLAEPVRRGKTRVAPGTIFAVPSSLVAVDCGPDLRIAAVGRGGLDLDRSVRAFGMRPIEEGLRVASEASPLFAVVATPREVRASAVRASE